MEKSLLRFDRPLTFSFHEILFKASLLYIYGKYPVKQNDYKVHFNAAKQILTTARASIFRHSKGMTPNFTLLLYQLSEKIDHMFHVKFRLYVIQGM